MCGYAHEELVGRVVVEEREEHEAWLSQDRRNRP
jgi:heme/copper-type cytochrome/quinol oxidase subunit 2